MLYYGQIRPTNYQALFDHYDHAPPWPMDRAPHISLVTAVLNGTDITRTAYCDYLIKTHGDDWLPTLHRQRSVVEELLQAPEHTVQVQYDSVINGNHRTAVCLVTGKTLHREQQPTYQTLELPDCVVKGRRLGDRTVDYDFTGKRVIDLGCNDGMLSIYALACGASAVVAVDADLCSTTWQVRNAWNAQDRMLIDVANIDTWEGPPDADVVMAFSVMKYLDPAHFSKLIHGRDCILESHMSGEAPPSTGHNWTKIGTSPYRRAQPDLTRDIFLGKPC